MITCTEYCATIGSIVDQLYISNEKRDPEHTLRYSLQLKWLNLPNATLRRGWYDGHQNLSYLTFDACELQVIEADAFMIAAFTDLFSIRMNNMHGLLFVQASFARIPCLRGLEFENVTYSNGDELILERRRHSLRRFAFEQSATQKLDFNYLFGKFRLFQMRDVSVMDVADLHILAYSNFTGLYVVEYLTLVNCGIDVIRARAFDFILETLVLVNLSGNRLKTLPADLFSQNRYIDAFSLILADNLLDVCDCDFGEVTNALLAYPVFTRTDFGVPLPICEPYFEESMSLRAECKHLHQIDTRRIGAIGLPFDYVLLVKSGIAVDNDHRVATVRYHPGRRVYIVVFHRGGRHAQFGDGRLKCSRRRWNGAYVTCQRVAYNGTMSVRVDTMMREAHNLQSFMVCLSAAKRMGANQFWPFDCIVTRHLSADEEEPNDSWRWWLLAVFVGNGCLVAVIGFVLFRRMR